MLQATGFSPFWVYHTSHKYPLMCLQESDNLQHCKSICSLKNYMKMVKLSNAVDASKKPLHFLGAQKLTKTMLNQYSFQKNSPNFPRISYRVFWAFLASERMTEGASEVSSSSRIIKIKLQNAEVCMCVSLFFLSLFLILYSLEGTWSKIVCPEDRI